MIALAALALAAQAGLATPLLDYAATLSFDTAPEEARYRRALVVAEHELKANPPPASDCARTLGAARFAALLENVGSQRTWLADHAGAADAYSKALGCTPRTAYLYAELAQELMDDGRYDEAQAAVTRGLAIAHEDYELGSILARLDFIKERWPDAIGWLRWAAAATPDRKQEAYSQCLLWLAQARSGIAHPQLPQRPTDGWPAPILDALDGTASEAQLLAAVQDNSSELERRQALAEALFYVGEQRLAAGDAPTARRYFAATVNLKVIYYIEHALALAELAKMRAAAGPP